ncbi:MAG: hypothetical protein KDK91_07900, partial [Gammaproteobacteria bacterium]|nr:hypothetical protein [Gammaproteobacteria bacterium]
PVTPPVTPLTLLVDALGVTEPAVYLQAENVFQYDFANDFWFARVDRAGSGEAGEAVQAFVHEAASETQAQALLTRLLDEHQYDYTTVEAATTSDWQPHWHLLRHRFLDSLFAVARAGRYLYGVEKAPAAEPAARLMQRLDAHLATVARVPSGPSGPSVAGQR